MLSEGNKKGMGKRERVHGNEGTSFRTGCKGYQAWDVRVQAEMATLGGETLAFALRSDH